MNQLTSSEWTSKKKKISPLWSPAHANTLNHVINEDIEIVLKNTKSTKYVVLPEDPLGRFVQPCERFLRPSHSDQVEHKCALQPLNYINKLIITVTKIIVLKLKKKVSRKEYVSSIYLQTFTIFRVNLQHLLKACKRTFKISQL